MVKKKENLFLVKKAETLEEKDTIAREIAILKILEGKLSTRIPILNRWFPSFYTYAYREIPGDNLESTLYWDLTKIQKVN